MTRCELIVYATPGGELGSRCDEYFAAIRASGWSTTAQTYPPHATLTGFFRRERSALDRIITELGGAMESVPEGPVRVDALSETDRWVGLEISSEWLIELAASFAAVHRLEAGDDAVRLKDWLHVSLAYGDLAAGTTIGACAELARSMVDVDVDATWSIGLWERQATGWSRHL